MDATTLACLARCYLDSLEEKKTGRGGRIRTADILLPKQGSMYEFRAFSGVGYRLIPPHTTLTGGTNGGTDSNIKSCFSGFPLLGVVLSPQGTSLAAFRPGGSAGLVSDAVSNRPLGYTRLDTDSNPGGVAHG